jgi:4'-phosphopantetheinyl transferase superfamily
MRRADPVVSVVVEEWERGVDSVDLVRALVDDVDLDLGQIRRDARGRILAERGAVSLSHSDDIVVVAATESSVRLGIDVERARGRRRLDALARRVMTDDEFARWNDGGATEEDFVGVWTEVEAYAKALGDGIAGGLRRRPDDAWHVEALDTTALGISGAYRVTLVVEHPHVDVEIYGFGSDDWDPPAAAETSPTLRFAESSIGSALGAAMSGLGAVLEPSKKREIPAIVIDHEGNDGADEPILMRLDPDNPADSIVVIRRPVGEASPPASD